jgi:RNA-directed DNA polymerase
MTAELTSKRKLNLAYKQVHRNKGVGGVDEMGVAQLKDHLQANGAKYIEQIRVGDYQPSPILGIEIPKSNGKTRLLGIPTVTDRIFQQAMHQVLQPIFEPDFQ